VSFGKRCPLSQSLINHCCCGSVVTKEEMDEEKEKKKKKKRKRLMLALEGCASNKVLYYSLFSLFLQNYKLCKL
jgi:hypothetical protein